MWSISKFNDLPKSILKADEVEHGSKMVMKWKIIEHSAKIF